MISEITMNSQTPNPHVKQDAPNTLDELRSVDKVHVEEHLQGSIAYNKDTRQPTKKENETVNKEQERVNYIKDKKQVQKSEQEKLGQLSELEKEKYQKEAQLQNKFFGVKKSKKVRDEMDELENDIKDAEEKIDELKQN